MVPRAHVRNCYGIRVEEVEEMNEEHDDNAHRAIDFLNKTLLCYANASLICMKGDLWRSLRLFI